MSQATAIDCASVEWHAIFTLNGKVHTEFFMAPSALLEAEEVFNARHPEATYWELGK